MRNMFADGDVYEIAGDKLYYRDGVALFTTREGKVNAALGTAAVLSDERFDFSDAYVMSVGMAVKRFGLLDRLIILRVAVNMDNFPSGVTPEMLWGPKSDDHISSENSMESVDIFETAMHNCFDAGKIVIDAILEGEL